MKTTVGEFFCAGGKSLYIIIVIFTQRSVKDFSVAESILVNCTYRKSYLNEWEKHCM